MVALDWTVERRGSVTFVEVLVANRTGVPRAVRVENRLEGVVRPPRRSGVPARGWDETGFEATLAAGEQRGLGYACAATPVEPPVELVRDDPAPDARETGRRRPAKISSQVGDRAGVTPADRDIERSADGAMRALGDPRPPKDAVRGGGSRASGEPESSRREPEFGALLDSTVGDEEVPTPVARWLDRVEAAVGRVESLAKATTLGDATTELDREGGVSAVEELTASVVAERERLRAVRERVESLRERSEAASESVPVTAFRRLA